jgi:hypothetical protein
MEIEVNIAKGTTIKVIRMCVRGKYWFTMGGKLSKNISRAGGFFRTDMYVLFTDIDTNTSGQPPLTRYTSFTEHYCKL